MPNGVSACLVAATMSTVTDVPLHFKAVSITLQPDKKSGVSAANSILYQMSGSTRSRPAVASQNVPRQRGLFIAGGKTT